MEGVTRTPLPHPHNPHTHPSHWSGRPLGRWGLCERGEGVRGRDRKGVDPHVINSFRGVFWGPLLPTTSPWCPHDFLTDPLFSLVPPAVT